MNALSAELYGERLQGGVVRTVELDHAAISAPNGMEPAGLTGELRALPAGDFLITEKHLRTAGRGALARLVKIDEFGKGRRDSRNEVYFGQLVVSSDTAGEHTELVAVKPLKRAKDAAREYGATVHVNGLEHDTGRPLSFVPLGFYRQEDGRTSLITRYAHEVRSLDNVFWTDLAQDQKVVGNALGYCAASLGYLHANGLVHGDAQAKNQAVDGSGVRYIDLTATDFAAHPTNPFYTQQAIEADVRTLLRSVDLDDDMVREAFAGPYADFVAESGLPAEARLRVDDVMSLQP